MSKATSDKDFESLLDNYDYKFKKGDLVKGVVFGYESDNALAPISTRALSDSYPNTTPFTKSPFLNL